MIRTQRGITALGFLFLAALVGVIAFAAIRLVPVYLEYYKIVTIMEGVQTELDGHVSPTGGVSEIRRSIENRMMIESVRVVKLQEFNIEKQGAFYRVSIGYAQAVPYIANISLVVNFDKSVEIKR